MFRFPDVRERSVRKQMSEISFEVLRERFPKRDHQPFGEVLVIPSKRFQRGWELELEAQGHRVFVGDYNGEAALYQAPNDEFHVKVAENIEEACVLMEAGFDYVGRIHGVEVFRKRK